MAGDPRAGPLRRVTRLAERLGDVFVLVVETGRDFTQPAGFRPAFFEVRPRVELLARRSTIAAAGELAPAIQCHRLGRKPKSETMDFAWIGRRLCAGLVRARDDERCHSVGNRGAARQAHYFIGSHWRVSVPQNSTQSS